jgi:hypothetical protein
MPPAIVVTIRGGPLDGGKACVTEPLTLGYRSVWWKMEPYKANDYAGIVFVACDPNLEQPFAYLWDGANLIWTGRK